MQIRMQKIQAQIQEARSKGTRLFLCGLNHNPPSNFTTQAKVVELVEPHLILLEGSEPTQSYDGKTRQGNGFEEELANAHIPRPVPNLISIRELVDARSIVVRGFDVDEETDEGLVGKYRIENGRFVDEMEIFKSRLEELGSLEQVFAAAVRSFNPIYGGINQAIQNARIIRELVGQFMEADGVFRTSEGLKDHCERIEGYLAELEGMLAANIRALSQDSSSTLVFVGAGHLQEDQLLRFLEKEAPLVFSVSWQE